MPELKAAYDGPNREKFVAELDRFIEEFRRKHGPQIPVAEAYAILKEIEARFGRVEWPRYPGRAERKERR